jgi:hypothetical protein
MLGHLVFGRYGASSDRDEHVTRNPSNWIERFMGALLHPRRTAPRR